MVPRNAGAKAALAGAGALLVIGVVASLTAHHATTALFQSLSPLPTKNTVPTKSWNGLPEQYKFEPFVDMEHTDDRVNPAIDPWTSDGQYGNWMGIQDTTINGFGCGDKGPLDCFVGTTPAQHFARSKVANHQMMVSKTQSLSPLPGPNTVPTKSWNGLPEQYKFDPFVDTEHPYDRTSVANPWTEDGQYGMWMGIKDTTINGFGCGDNGPLDCFVGTTPAQHFAVGRHGINVKKAQALIAEPTNTWNGLPEAYHTNPFAENPAEQTTANPWSENGQYGVYQRFNDATTNSYGCGPGGPLNCNVGTTPAQHWVVAVPVEQMPLERRAAKTA